MGVTLPARITDYSKYTIRVLQYLIVPESQHQPTTASKVSIPGWVSLTLRVLPTAGFHCNPQIHACEIENVRRDGMLASEVPAKGMVA